MSWRNSTLHKLVKVPIFEPITRFNIYEHTPADFYKYGQYTRFIRPIRPPYIKYEICKERIKE